MLRMFGRLTLVGCVALYRRLATFLLLFRGDSFSDVDKLVTLSLK